jgi:hypothetical protein
MEHIGWLCREDEREICRLNVFPKLFRVHGQRFGLVCGELLVRKVSIGVG